MNQETGTRVPGKRYSCFLGFLIDLLLLYLGNRILRLKLTRLPLSLAATVAALPFNSEIAFLD
jgi:hypothetical protein